MSDALKCVRADVIWLEDRFPHRTQDRIWLAEAGAQNWLVISRDKRIRYRPGERAAIMDNAVGCFCFTQKQDLTRWEYLKLVVRTLDDMEQRYAETERPFLYAVGAGCRL